MSRLKIYQTQSETPDQNELKQRIILYKRNKSRLQAGTEVAAIGYNGRELRISKSHRIIVHQKLKCGHNFFLSCVEYKFVKLGIAQNNTVHSWSSVTRNIREELED